MKKNALTILIVALIVFGGLQVFASTYSEPADQSQNAAKPVDVSVTDQVMDSNFYSKQFLKAGSTVGIVPPSTSSTPTWNRTNAYVAEKAIVTPRFIVSGNTGLLSKKSQLRIGSPNTSASLPASQPFAGDMITPVIVDMNGRGSVTNDPAGREAIELHSTYSPGMVSAKPHITVSTPAFQFSSTTNTSNGNDNRKADVIAGKLAFSDNQTSGTGVKVLVATDTLGNAVWGTMKIVSNTDGTKRIQVDYPGSPVATGQAMCN